MQLPVNYGAHQPRRCMPVIWNDRLQADQLKLSFGNAGPPLYVPWARTGVREGKTCMSVETG